MSLNLATVSKIYGDRTKHPVHAVREMNLDIDDGEIIALLGSSGCGKTSTLRMIAGFESVTRGEIHLAGKRIDVLPPAQRGVAMAFEGYALYPPLTIAENIGFALRGSRGDTDKQVREIAELLEIGAFLDRRPNGLSGGQQQRASLARALIRNANLHLLDEPMGQLEPQLRAVLRGRVKARIRERGYTAVLVTHDQGEANAMADRIAVMYGGRTMESGDAEAIFSSPLHPYTKGLIGCVPNIEMDMERLVSMPGSPPDLVSPPAGCPFAPRCPKVMEICKTAVPPLVAHREAQQAACWLYDEKHGSAGSPGAARRSEGENADG